MTYLLIEVWFDPRCYKGTNPQRDEKLSPRLKITLVLVRLNHISTCIVKGRITRTWCNAICDGVNVGDAFRQVEGLVMVSGSDSA